MGNKRKTREAGFDTSARGSGSSRDRWEEKRRRFAEDDGRQSRGGMKPTTLITVGAIVLVVVFVAVVVFQAGGGASTASAATIQQTETTAATVAGGKISVPVDEVKAKKIVYWDYKKADGKTVPLMAYVTPSGAMKMAVRICEPCNGFSFRIEGNQIVCNVCGTRWDLESLKGISGGCQGYPPDFLSSTVENGNLTVDEAKVLAWKVRA